MSRPALREVESPQPKPSMGESENGKRLNGNTRLIIAIVATALGTGVFQWGFSPRDDLAAMDEKVTAGLATINEKLEAQGKEFAEFRGSYQQNEKHTANELARMAGVLREHKAYIDKHSAQLAGMEARLERQ